MDQPVNILGAIEIHNIRKTRTPADGFVPTAYVAIDSEFFGTEKVSLDTLLFWFTNSGGGGGGGGDISQLAKKADKVQGSRLTGKLATLTIDGNLANSGISASDIALSSELHFHSNKNVLDQITQTAWTELNYNVSNLINHPYSHPTYSSKPLGLYKVSRDSTGHIGSASAVTKVDICALGIPAQDTTYTAGSGIRLDTSNGANKFVHTNSVTAASIGTDQPTTGSTVDIPYFSFDAQGHIRMAGLHQHTVAGVLPSMPASPHGDLIVSANSAGTTSWQEILYQTFGTTPNVVDLWISYKNREFVARRAYEDESGRNIKSAIDDRFTESQVNAAIEAALANYGGFKVVEADPNTGEPDVADPSMRFIYLTKISGTKKDRYEEWIWDADSPSGTPYWQCIGETSINLDNYLQKIESPTAGHFVQVNADGTIADSTKCASDFATAAQGLKADSAIQSIMVNGTSAVTGTTASITVPVAGTVNPTSPGTVSPGVAAAFSREDHVHPHDSAKQDSLPTTGTAVDTYAINITGSAASAQNVHDGILSITVGAGTAQTFSANQATDAPVSVTIPMGKEVSGDTPVYRDGLISAADYRRLDEIAVNDGTLRVQLGSAIYPSTLFSANQYIDSLLTIPLAGYETSNNTTVYTEGLITGRDKERIDQTIVYQENPYDATHALMPQQMYVVTGNQQIIDIATAGVPNAAGTLFFVIG